MYDEPTNEDRAEWARAGVWAFGEETNQIRKDGSMNDELETITQDLLSDIMHLCDVEGFDFDDVLRRARGNYDEERAEAGMCSECETTEDVESSYCGSFCPVCFAKHCEECGVCADD